MGDLLETKRILQIKPKNTSPCEKQDLQLGCIFYRWQQLHWPLHVSKGE